MSRLVECQDCGYRWESSAESPRCAKADCGRSRNVEPVEDADADADDLDADADADADDLDADDDRDDDGFRPSFETTEQRADIDPEPVDDVIGTDADDDRDDEHDDEPVEDADADEWEDAPELDPSQLETGFEVTFEAVAARRGEHWTLDDDRDEAAQLAQAWTPVLNNYAPALFREHTEVGVAVMATVSILGPRLAEDRRRREQEQEREQAKQDGEPGETREPTVVEDDADALDAADEQDEWTAPDDTAAEQSGWANA